MDDNFRIVRSRSSTVMAQGVSEQTPTEVAEPEDDPIIQQLAVNIRRAYCLAYRMASGCMTYGEGYMAAWDGDPSGRSGRRTQNIWPKIARKLISLQAEPTQFIQAQFSMRLDRLPTPNKMLSDDAVANWQSYRQHVTMEVRHKIESDQNQLRLHVEPLVRGIGWSIEAATEYAIKDENCGASPLFKYCEAVRLNLPVAVQLRPRALAQYLMQQEQFDAMSVGLFTIPQELRQEALQLRSIPHHQ